MFPLTITTDVELRPFAPQDAPALIKLIMENREHLDSWMRWTARIQSQDDAAAFIARFVEKLAAGSGFHVGMWHKDQLVGGIACHDIDRQSNNTEIGYWLGAAYTGHGWVTLACRAIIRHLFEHEQVHRIEIQCMTDNLPSRAVAERLGFSFEGIKRESEWITSAYRDHALYSLLVHEWQAQQPRS